LFKAKSAKKKSRKVLLYEKADMDGLKTFIKDKRSEKTRGSHTSSSDVIAKTGITSNKQLQRQ
jgi:hypothetical protein